MGCRRVKLIRAALDIEREHADLYRLDEDERADLQEALAEFDGGRSPLNRTSKRSSINSAANEGCARALAQLAAHAYLLQGNAP